MTTYTTLKVPDLTKSMQIVFSDIQKPSRNAISVHERSMRGDFQLTGEGGGGGGCSKLEFGFESDEYVYLGCREDSIARATS